jgi:very-short-patch-repair endonuclease
LELDWGTSRFGVPARFKDVAVESDESVFRLTESPLDEAVRDELLRSKGWKVVRVWSREVWEGKDVKALLDASAPRSTSGGPR